MPTHEQPEPDYTITVLTTGTGHATSYVTGHPHDLGFTAMLVISLHHRRHGGSEPYTWQIGTPATSTTDVTYLLSAAAGVPTVLDGPQHWFDLRKPHPVTLRATAPDGSSIDTEHSGTPVPGYTLLRQAAPGEAWTVAAFGQTPDNAAEAAAPLVGSYYLTVPTELVSPGIPVRPADVPYPDPLDASGPPYPYVRAWCRIHGATSHQAGYLITTAILEHAPPTATFRDAAGNWYTTETISNPSLWRRIDIRVRQTHGERFALGPYPWHEAAITVNVRIAAASWSGSEQDFHTYIQQCTDAINSAKTQLLPRVTELGGTVKANLQQ